MGYPMRADARCAQIPAPNIETAARREADQQADRMARVFLGDYCHGQARCEGSKARDALAGQRGNGAVAQGGNRARPEPSCAIMPRSPCLSFVIAFARDTHVRQLGQYGISTGTTGGPIGSN